MAEKNCFDMTKLIFQIMHVCRCGAVVKGVCPLFSVSLYRFFFFFFYCFVSFFNTIFRFGLFFLYSYCLTCWSCTWINMILRLSPGFILEKGFQNLLICILVKLTTRKKHKLSRHIPPLKQLNFFQC